MKKFVALVLTVVMLLALSVTVFAIPDPKPVPGIPGKTEYSDGVEYVVKLADKDSFLNVRVGVGTDHKSVDTLKTARRSPSSASRMAGQ